jgi:DNA-binding winged helix-turn-helix (wHTH) protein
MRSSRPSFIETVTGKGYRFIAGSIIANDSERRAHRAGTLLAVLPFENISKNRANRT